MDAPEELPIVRPQFYIYKPLPLACHVKAFHVMAEMALLHSPFQGDHSESAKRHLTAVPVIGHVMPCPMGVSLSWMSSVEVHTHIRIQKGCLL